MLRRLLYYYRKGLYRINPRQLYLCLSSIDINKPIFFLGVQGGGLTLIMKAMQRHSQTCFCGGNSNHWDAADNEMHVNIPDMPSALSFRNNDVFPDKYRTNSFRYWTYALDETIHLYRLEEESIRPLIEMKFQEVIKKVIRAYAHNIQNCRFIDKSQLFTINVLPIHKMLQSYSPYFVLVTRDPFAMCKRVAERYYGNPYKNNFSFSKKTNLQLCCQHWKNSYSYAIEDGKYILNFMVARFEDFLIDPRNFLKEICDFVELEFDEKMVPASNQRSTYFGQMKSRWYPLRQDANSRYLNELTNDEIDIIKLNCGELIDKFGYQAPTRS